ncbi:hypothetical protein ACFXHA_44340 [Nocardia sp. NPDC059240]|uniref:hypothetical protein n=1 Tax=Nocardia sp. NPDC059240 TaxID=3346786 RepID=UPI0036BA7FF8
MPAEEPKVDIAKLPLCDDPRPGSSGTDDCKLVSRDRAGYLFVVRHLTLEETTAIRTATRVMVVNVVSKNGKTSYDALTEAGSGLMLLAEPMLHDIDADGRDELLVPLAGGSGGTTYAVYRDSIDDPGRDAAHFVKIGEVNGSIPEHTDSGYIAVVGKGGLYEKEVAFMKIENSQLRKIVRVEIDLKEDSSGHRHGTCKLLDASGLAGSGLTDAEVTQRFCNESIVLKYE